jgi:hypothetical protein
MNRTKLLRLTAATAAIAAATTIAHAQANLPIYTDHLVNGFQDWSWGPRNLSCTTLIHSGSDSISGSLTNWQGLSFEHPDFNVSPYASFSFWIHGGTNGGGLVGGGQVIQVSAVHGTNSGPAYVLPALSAGPWQQYTIPLSTLGVANATNVNRFNFQLTASGSTNMFYLDDIQLNAAPAPAVVHLTLQATQALRSADARWAGFNTAIWDGNFDTPQTVSLLKEAGTTILRFPGGSLSDEYHWAINKSLTNAWQWQTSFTNFMHVATNVGAQAFITVNYGTGTANEASNWVHYANNVMKLGFKYWEIGNENYGASWETDSNTFPHDPFTYATRASNYFFMMRAADPTIKIGVVVTPGENSYSNGYSNNPAYNPRTGQTNYGWTAVVLTTLKSQGITPDFLIHHVYPEYTGQESDPLLLQSAVNWAHDAAHLRQQVSDYIGAGGQGIELLSTENNSNAGNQGRQSTSLVNGLYYADSLGQLMKTEFNAMVWWDLRNSTDTKGSFDPTLYGWRSYGDLGVINGLTNRDPTFYAFKLMQSFVSAGDTVLNATSDYLLLSVYATRHTNGSVSLLVLNKDTTTNFNAQVAINGFSPYGTATMRSYGIPQDEATRTNAAYSAQDISTSSMTGISSSFSQSFPPLSMTLLTLAPNSPQLLVLPPAPQPGGPLVLQLQGQPGIPYILQTSTNFGPWFSVSTNTLVGSSLSITNPTSPSNPLTLFRALWQP